MEDPPKRKRGRPRKNPLPLPDAVVVKRKPGRPRKNPVQEIPAPLPVSTDSDKEFVTISIADLEFWAGATDKPIFKQAIDAFHKLKQAKASPEIKLYFYKIEVATAK